MRTALREKDGERVIYEVQRHWLVLAKPVLIFACALLVYIYSFLSSSPPMLHALNSTLLYVVGGSGVFLLYSVQLRKVDRWYLTQFRLISEEGIGVKKTKESPLAMINNVEYSQPFLGQWLGYGVLEIQTAATEGASIESYVSDPIGFHDAIVGAQQAIKQQNNANGTNRPVQAKRPSSDTMECPQCAEIIMKKAKKCRYCGFDLTQNTITEQVAVSEKAAPTSPPSTENIRPSDGPPSGDTTSPRDWLH